jgi:hypothetical protein
MSVSAKLSALGLGLGLACVQPVRAAPPESAVPVTRTGGVIKLSAEQIAVSRIQLAPVGPGSLSGPHASGQCHDGP